MNIEKLSAVTHYLEGLDKTIVTQNRALIAEFIDKVVLVDAKKTTPKATSKPYKLDLSGVKAVVQQQAMPILHLPTFTAPQATPAPITLPKFEATPVQAAVFVSNDKPVEQIPITPKKRNGNGHKVLKVRSLTPEERDHIAAEFLSLNGQIEEDLCTIIRDDLNAAGDGLVSPFQVTGFVTLCHSYVAKGKMILADYAAYESFLKAKKNALWQRYNAQWARDLRSK
jgi:hypothetical protein